MLAAILMGLYGGNIIDALAPLYTVCVSALIVAKYLAEKKSDGLPKGAGEEEEVDDNRSTSSTSSSAGGSSKPLSALKEPTTGLTIPASLPFVDGGTGPLVSVGCGPRVKELGFIKVKVYALGVFVESTAASRDALEPLAKAGGADLFKALLKQDSATFFRRALHLVFARSVTGKQVADALAEKLKANLSPATFNAFSQTLLDGIGTKGLNEGETLTFVWSAPSELRVFVRGQPCAATAGSGGGGAAALALKDEALPRVLHAGLALGPDPAVPEAKRTTGLQIARVFHQAGSRSGSGGGPQRVGNKVSAPVVRNVTEPATGLPMPTELSLNAGSSSSKSGGPDAGKENSGNGAAVQLKLLGCGVKVKKLGFIDVQVYAVGVFAEPQGCKAAIMPWHQKHSANKTGSGPGSELENELFDALLAGGPPASSSGAPSSSSSSSIAFYPRALHLVFARSVSGKQVADALAERLKLVVSAAAFNAFSDALLTGIGGDTPLAKGETLSYLWSAPNVVRVFVRGACVGDVNDEKLPRTLFVGFLGPNEPQSPAAKAAVPAGAAALFLG